MPCKVRIRYLNNTKTQSCILDEEPSLKDRVIAFFKGSPKRYSFAPEMDGAAKRWIQEYKKIFDLVAKYNAGMNVVTNQIGVESAEGRGQSAATQVPKSVIKRIGKVVPEVNGEESAEGRVQSAETTPSTAGGPPPSRGRLSAENKIVRLGKLADSDKKNATGTENVQDSGERFAATRPKYSDYDKPITFADVEAIHKIYERDEKLSINKFTAEDIEATQKWAYKFYKELGVKSPFFRAWFGDWRAYDHSPVNIVEIDNQLKIILGSESKQLKKYIDELK